MSRIFLLFSLLVLTLNIQAQRTNNINGTVVDSTTLKPLFSATVRLFKDDGKTLVKGLMTDGNGIFQINGIASGSYMLRIGYMGYLDRSRRLTLSTGAPNLNLGKISLASDGQALKEIAIVGKVPLVQNKIDKLVYNAEKDITGAGGTAIDILGKVPMVSADMNGNVSVRGNQNVRVLLNGKSTGSTSAGLSDVLRSIPADQIKNIEVITNPSAKYDGEGSAGILNIITKSKNSSGTSGSVNGGLGTRQNNGNVNLNYNSGKFHSSFNIGSFFSWPQTTTGLFQQQISTATVQTQTSSTNSTKVSRKAINGSFNAGYDIDEHNSFNTNIRLMRFESNTDGIVNTIAASPYNSTSTGEGYFRNFDWGADFTHKFSKEGHEISMAGQWSKGANVNDYTNYYTDVFPSIANAIEGKNSEYTLQMDYTLPIDSTLKLETGAKNIIRKIGNFTDFYNLPINSSPIYDPINSNIYNYDQNVLAFYGLATVNLTKKWTLLAGLRSELTNIKGNPKNGAQALNPFSQDYHTFIPSLTIQYSLDEKQSFKMIYSRRITRPNLEYLNPFVNISNIQNQTTGNPTLGPETSTTYELNYNVIFGSSSLNTSFYYRRTGGLIEGIASPISVLVNGTSLGGTLTKYENIGSNNSIGGSIFGNVTILKKLNFNGNINTFSYKPISQASFTNSQTQNGTYLMLNGFVRASLELQNGFIAEAFGFGSSSRRTIQGTNPAFSMYGLGMKKQFLDKKASLGINIIQPFSAYRDFNSSISSPGFSQTTSSSIPFRSFGLTFSYSFGKLNFEKPSSRKSVKNDDLGQGGQQQGNGNM